MVVRGIEIGDAPEAARLSTELGYPVTPIEMEERIRRRAASADHMVFVAAESDTVLGWIDVGIVDHLQSEPYAEIGGLVVSSQCRSRGIGARLVARAEQWARERHLSRMVVRSRVEREAAHRFYLRDGYERTKTSAVFSKKLD